MYRGQRTARATVKTAAALIPNPESQIMGETWAADLEHADQLGVDRRDIARGAIAFVLRRGVSAWCRRQWVRAVLVVIVLLASVAFIPAWLLVPVVALGLLVWLIAAPTRAMSEPLNTHRNLP